MGDVVWNPLTGEKAMIVESAEETGGARVVADFAVEAGGFVPGGEHVHDHLAEHVEIRDGSTFVLDGEERTLAVGEQLTVAPGTWHRRWNAGEGEVQARVRIEPAMRFEEAILVIRGLCADGHTNAEGRPSPLLGALLATRYRREIRYRQPPDAVSKGPVPAARRARAATGPGAHRRSLPRSRDAPRRRIGARSPPGAGDAAGRRARVTRGMMHGGRRASPLARQAGVSTSARSRPKAAVTSPRLRFP
jgi:mannose-6-phosphate isomerase-like protein (cupin superfamily)